MRLSSIDTIRTFAILAVVAIHCDPLTGPSQEYCWGSLGDFIDLICRFAVPFFLITSGYLLARRVQSRGTNQTGIMPFIVRMGGLIIVWYGFYLVWPLDWGLTLENGLLRSTYWNLNTLFKDTTHLLNGPRIHLWFLSALLISGLHVFLVSLCRSNRVIFFYFLVIYLAGLALGPYAMFFSGSLTEITSTGRWTLPPFIIAIGWLSATQSLRVRFSASLSLVALGTVLTLVEALLLHNLYGTPLSNHDFLMGTPIQAFGLLQLALNKPELGDQTVLPLLGRYSLGVYATHVAVIDLLDARSGGSLTWEVMKTFVVYGVTVSVVMVIARSRTLRRFVT